jgi:hypothetical protein
MTAALAVGGAVLLAMVCVSWYGWVTLPGDARVPVHFGVTYNNFVPKRVGLIIHPAAGAVVLVITAVAGKSAGHPSHGAPLVIFPVIMAVLLVVQIGAITVARRRSGS